MDMGNRNVHLMEVMVSLDDLPSNASLRTTGYLPGLDRSIDPEATAAMMLWYVFPFVMSKDTKSEVGGMWIKIEKV